MNDVLYMSVSSKAQIIVVYSIFMERDISKQKKKKKSTSELQGEIEKSTTICYIVFTKYT